MKTEQMIKELEKKGYKIDKPKTHFIDFPKLKLRFFTEVIKADTFNKTSKLIPKGKRLPYLWELFYILEDEKIRKLLSPKEDWLFFWTKQNQWDKEKNRLSGLNLSRNLDMDSDWHASDGSLSNSYDDGRVVFVENLK